MSDPLPTVLVPGLNCSARLYGPQIPALRGEVRLMNEENGADAYVRQQTAIRARADSRPDLAAIDCPTLVLVGDGDEATPPEMAREIADGIRGARLVVVPDCGHLSTM